LRILFKIKRLSTLKIRGKEMEKELRKHKDRNIQIPEIIPILIVLDGIVFPELPNNIFISKAESIILLREISKKRERLIGIVIYKKDSEEFYSVGTVAEIQRTIQVIPEFYLKKEAILQIHVHGIRRFRIKRIVQDTPYYKAEIELLSDQSKAAPNQVEARIGAVRAAYLEFLELFKRSEMDMLKTEMINAQDPGYIADLAIFTIPTELISIEEKQEILETLDVGERLEKVLTTLYREVLKIKTQKKIGEELGEEQRKFIIREQIKKLKDELGEEQEEVKKYRKAAELAKLSEEARKAFDEDLEKFSRMDPRDPTRQYIDSWLDWMVSLPWSVSTEDRLDISEAEKILEEDHYGLENVKKRIIEFLAVRKLKPQGRGPLLCFIGPPGTGKTSVGKSIARAMGRKFIRISLGGVYDEAQIRGHRRTYVGALPGIIIQELKRAGSMNPVFMIDEIDKIGTQRLQGDPSSALLEVLDPEQNYAFTDHYLNVPFDLSKVMFICTGNLADPIQPALQDRMEIIDFPGYTREEKLMIAKKYLVPKQVEANGLTNEQLQFKDKGLQSIIRDYTREAGVRNLEREIGKICRRIATRITKNEISQEIITEDKLFETLGPKRYISQLKERISRPGVAIGLAWTPVGGEILFIEAEMIREIREPNLEITGNVEKIMQESAMAALTFVEANLEMLGIPSDRSPVGNKVHIHVPEAAVPKDGPSAGIAMLVALVSLLRKQRVRDDLAMTGEITLRGVVRPVGGIKEKVLAAKEAGIKTIILPKENEKDLQDLPESVKKALERKEIEIKFISEMKEALSIALKS